MAALTTSASRTPKASQLGPPRWYSHRWNRGGLYRIGAALATKLPRRERLFVARAVASVARVACPAERRAVQGNLARIFPTLAPADRDALTRKVFQHFAMCFTDLLAVNPSTPSRATLLGRVDGEAQLEEAFGDGHGVIVLTAHLGNWELGGRLMADRLGRLTHVVVAAEADPGVERFLRSRPASIRFVVRERPTAAIELMAALRRGEVVALQGDRALGDRSDVTLPFFGAAARFPLGPFILARASGAPLVPAFCILDEDRRYTVTVGGPIRVELDGERAALSRWVVELERMVRQHPQQWFNFFDVWSPAPAR